MKVLALDAALGPFSVAVAIDGVWWGQRSAANDALEAGIGRIADVLGAAGIGLKDCDRIAVGVGPGSFTGIRIAISYAKSLSYGAGVPLVGISSYDVLTPAGAPRPSLTVIGGRRGVICARRHDLDGAISEACGPTPDVLARLAPAGMKFAHIAGAASVLAELPSLAGERVVPAALEQPARAIAALALERSPAESPHEVKPDYGEMPAVTPTRSRTTPQLR